MDGEDQPLSESELLAFGPCVEAVAWTPVWVQEARAPIAVAAGRAKLGPIFNSDGVGKAVIIRPCMSRGRRVRGLRPVYTPQMLEANAGVFSGWPMFMDHLPAELAAKMAQVGRSVKDLGGQVLASSWHPTFVHEDDEQYGYRKGAVVGDVWASPVIRETVGENPNLLHTSINAWPKSARPGPVPWRPALKGMLIEGIRSLPQGSVDYVVRGGAGGRLLVAEGVEEEGAWPEVGEWDEESKRLVVSLAESVYASRHMSGTLQLPTKPDELQEWLQQHAPHLLPALAEAAAADDGDADDKDKRKRNGKRSDDTDTGMSEAEVRRLVVGIVEEANGKMPTVEEFTQRLTESFQGTLEEREQQKLLGEKACQLIESAEGLPTGWKASLKERYKVLPNGAPETLLVEGEHTDDDGKPLSEEQVVLSRVEADIEASRALIREAQGRPRVTGEGGTKRGAGGEGRGSTRGTAEYRKRLSQILGESEDELLDIYGPKVED